MWASNRFFIDAASAGSWSGCRARYPGTFFNPLDADAGFLNANDHDWYEAADPPNGHNLFPNNTYMWAGDPPLGTGWSSAENAGSAWATHAGTSGFGESSEDTAHGYPSRGIWGSHPLYSLMDLSWCSFPLGGLSEDDWDSPQAIGDASFNSQVNIRKLSDVAIGDTSAGSSAAAREFIEPVSYTHLRAHET